ncbi:MAG: HNH endonuclease [Dehalococcoidia bacterium]
MTRTVRDLILAYFSAHPGQDVRQGDVAVWVQQEYERVHGRPCLDPWREVRRLYQEGVLIKVRKGFYRYEPERATRHELPDFPRQVKEAIFQRDGYRCTVCNRGPKEGIEIVADHIQPIDKGGTNDVENGQTLCSEHNLLKKNYSQTEAGKRFFIRLYRRAVALNDERMIRFCQQIFDLYNSHKINHHIPRPDKRS